MTLVGFFGNKNIGNALLSIRDATLLNGNRFDYPYRVSCIQITGELSPEHDWCSGGPQYVPTVIIGDSFANAYSSMFDAYSKQIDTAFSFVQFGRGSCPMLLDYGPSYCQLITSKSFDLIQKSATINTVVLASNWPSYYEAKVQYNGGQKGFEIALLKTIQGYRNIGKRVIVLLAPPTGIKPQSCVLRPLRLTDKNACNLTIEKALKNDGSYRHYLIPLLLRMEVEYFDPFKYLCEDGFCKVTDGEKIFYADDEHLSYLGGEYIAKKGSLDLQNMFYK
jgi:hypothetical protein